MAQDADTTEVKYRIFGQQLIASSAAGSTSTDTSGQLTANAADLGEDANHEQFAFWQGEDPEKGVVLDNGAQLSNRIFSENLTEDVLVKDKSWLDASKVVYDMEHGEGAWDKRVADKNWNAVEAAEELGEWGLDHISDFNFQAWESADTAFFTDRNNDQNLALLYMMRAVEHKNMSWGGVGRAIGSIATDPATWGIGIISLVAAPFTGGLSLSGGLALVGAKTGATTAVAKVGQLAFTQALTKAVTNRVTSAATSKLVTNRVSQAVANSSITRALTSDLAVRAGRGGFITGAAEGYLTDRFMVYSVERDGHAVLGDDLQYTWGRAGQSTLMGAGFGWGMGRAFGGAGDALRRRFSKSSGADTPAAVDTTAPIRPPAEREIPDDAPAHIRDTFALPAMEDPSLSTQADMSGGGSAGSGGGRGGSGGKKPITLPPGAETLPELKQSKNFLNHVLFRYKFWNPGTWIDEFRTLRVESAKTNPTAILKPIFNYADKSMEKFGLTKALALLGQKIDSLPTDNIKTLQAAIKKEMAAFADANGENLQKFQAEMQALRDHFIQNVDNVTLDKNDGRFNALVKGKGHKEAMIAYLDNLIDISEDLQKADFGTQGARIRDLEYKEGVAIQSAKDLRDDGLHWLTTLATDAHARLHVNATRKGKEVNGVTVKVKAEEREADIRKVAAGLYISEPEFKKRQDSGNFEWTAMAAEEEYLQYLGDDKKTVSWPVSNKATFAQYYGEMIRLGYYQEALELADRTMRRKGSLGKLTIPADLTSQQAFKDEIAKVPGLWESNAFQEIKAKLDDTIASRSTGGKEGPGWSPRDEPGRRSEEAAIMRDNWWFYLRRYAGYDRMSTPAEITLQVKLAQNPVARLRAYWLGMETRPSLDADDASKGQLDVYRQWWWQRKTTVGDDASNFEVIKNYFNNTFYARSPWWVKMPLVYGSGGLTSVPGLTLLGGSTTLVGLEKASQWAFDHDEDTWYGNSGRWVGSKTLGFADWVNDNTLAPLSDYVLPDGFNNTIEKVEIIDEANAFLFRKGKNEVAAEPETSPETVDDTDPTADATRDRSSQPDYVVLRDDATGNGDGPADGEGARENDTDSQRAEADNSDNSRRGNRNTTRATTASLTENWASSGAGAIGDVFKDGFDWMDSGGGTMGKIGHFLSGAFGAVTGTIGKMYNGQVQDGQKWLAGGIGLIAALIGGPMLTNMLGPLGKFPLMGVAVSLLVFGYGGKLAHALMQGNGKNMPNTLTASGRQRHDGTNTEIERAQASLNTDGANMVGQGSNHAVASVMDTEVATQKGADEIFEGLDPEPAATMSAEVLELQLASNDELNTDLDEQRNVVNIDLARIRRDGGPPQPDGSAPRQAMV